MHPCILTLAQTQAAHVGIALLHAATKPKPSAANGASGSKEVQPAQQGQPGQPGPGRCAPQIPFFPPIISHPPRSTLQCLLY